MPTETAVSDQARLVMRQCIQKVATGPEYSKDLSQKEAYDAMRLILSEQADPVQAGVFLIALRMKRETEDENKGILQAILDATRSVDVDVDDLVDVADPYDGYTRGLPASPFLAPVLAALGLPALSHGLQEVGPKYGVTHRMVLRAAGIAVDLSSEQAAERVANPDLGWAYLDQKHACPALHALIPLRTRIVKRPVLTTVEVLMHPLKARGKNHLLTGYVHKNYPPVYAELARFAGFDSAMVVRGVEGGVIPSLQSDAKVFYYHEKGKERDWPIHPDAVGVTQANRAVPLPDHIPKAKTAGDETATKFDCVSAAAIAAEYGVKALAGEKGPTYDSLVYAGALCLKHVGRVAHLAEGAERVRQVLDSGAAKARLS